MKFFFLGVEEDASESFGMLQLQKLQMFKLVF